MTSNLRPTPLHRPSMLTAWTLAAGLLLGACSAGGTAGVAGQSYGSTVVTDGSGAQSGTPGTAQGAASVVSGNDTTTIASAESLASTGRLVLKGNSNKCMGVAPDGVAIGLFDCAGLGKDGWSVKGQSLVHSSGKCLAVKGQAQDGAVLALAPCAAGQNSQLWNVTATAITQGASGTFCLDVKDHLQVEGNPLQIWTCTAGDNQTWRVAPVAPTQAPTVQALVTSPDLTLALSSVTVDTGSTAQAAQADASIVLDPGITYQTITGFGASLTDSSTFVMHTGLTEPALEATMERLFDPSKGIGISLLRQTMGTSDFSSAGNYSYADQDNDFNLDSFNIKQDLLHTIPLLKTAVGKNPNLFVMATPWSPPAWMKNNNSMYGSPKAGGSSTLKGNVSASYAQYFVKFVQAYSKQGIKISAVTPQNEPLNDGTLPSMYFPAQDQADFVGNHLGPALKAAKLDTKVWGYDHNWDRLDYPQTLLDNSASRPFIAAAAFHCYGGSADAMTEFHNKNPNTDIQMTECSDGAWHVDSFADMTNLIIDSTTNWSKSVVFWNLALDNNAGPVNAGCTNCTALITVNTATHALSYNIDFYIMGQASKFVLPGAKRISSQVTGNNLKVVAFVNTDGSEVALVYNTSGSAQSVTLKGSSNTANVKVAARSLATIALAARATNK